MRDKFELSIIVSFDNRYELINNFLEHLLLITPIEHTEIIFISDGCKNMDTIQYLQKKITQLSNLKLICLDSKVGYSKANNIGVQNSNGKYLLFINTDVFPQHSSIKRMLNFLKKDDTVGAVQGLLLYPQNHLVQSTGHVFYKYINHHLYNGRKKDDLCVMRSAERQALTTAFCMMKREIFFSAGTFNEFYYNAYDGMELTLNIQKNEKKCYYLADAIAYHSTGGTRKKISFNNEYQSKYFYAHNNRNINNDLVFYIKRQLTTEHLRYCYFVINCSFFQNWDDLLSQLDIKYERFCEIEDRDNSAIDLYHNLSYAFLDDQTPFLFITDNFRNLSQNANWFSVRNNKYDIILDYHGNCVKPYEVFRR